jgi:nucleotide-binding universal stress UspA family protein
LHRASLEEEEKMSNVQKILAPVDFSDNSDAAVGYAVFLAQALDAVIELLHVASPPASAAHTMTHAGAPVAYDAVGKMMRESAEEQLGALLERLPPGARQRIVPRAELGSPDRTIVDMARRNNFDMIVMGTRGRSGLARLILGSVAEKVVRHAPCPVVTVPLAGGQA